MAGIRKHQSRPVRLAHTVGQHECDGRCYVYGIGCTSVAHSLQRLCDLVEGAHIHGSLPASAVCRCVGRRHAPRRSTFPTSVGGSFLEPGALGEAAYTFSRPDSEVFYLIVEDDPMRKNAPLLCRMKPDSIPSVHGGEKTRRSRQAGGGGPRYWAADLDLPVCAGRDSEFRLRICEWLRDDRARQA